MEQQLALCYAILGAATNSSSRLRMEAGEMCAVLLKRIVNQNSLEPPHHRFLAQLWDSVGTCTKFCLYITRILREIIFQHFKVFSVVVIYLVILQEASPLMTVP